MAAMILANSLIAKGVEISVLESPAVGIIGVDEGSTPWLRGLFDNLMLRSVQNFRTQQELLASIPRKIEEKSLQIYFW